MIADMAHDRQTLHVKGRPLCMTYRPWEPTGRPMCNLEALHDRQTYVLTYRPWQMTVRPVHNVEVHDMSNQ